MSRLWFHVPFLLVCAGLVLPATMAGSEEIASRSKHGSPPDDSVTWVLVAPNRKAKAALGAQLHAPSSSPTQITLQLNPTLQAQGQVATGGPYPDCKCINHYHGSLLGAADPDPDHCGWGCVVLFDSTPDSVQLFSAALMREARAVKRSQQDPLDYAGALQDVTDAITDLADLKTALQQEISPRIAPPGLTQATVTHIDANIDKASKLDGTAKDALTRLAGGNGGAGDSATVRKALSSAFNNKQKGMTLLLKALHLTGL